MIHDSFGCESNVIMITGLDCQSTDFIRMAFESDEKIDFAMKSNEHIGGIDLEKEFKLACNWCITNSEFYENFMRETKNRRNSVNSRRIKSFEVFDCNVKKKNRDTLIFRLFQSPPSADTFMHMFEMPFYCYIVVIRNPYIDAIIQLGKYENINEAYIRIAHHIRAMIHILKKKFIIPVFANSWGLGGIEKAFERIGLEISDSTIDFISKANAMIYDDIINLRNLKHLVDAYRLLTYTGEIPTILSDIRKFYKLNKYYDLYIEICRENGITP